MSLCFPVVFMCFFVFLILFIFSCVFGLFFLFFNIYIYNIYIYIYYVLFYFFSGISTSLGILNHKSMYGLGVIHFDRGTPIINQFHRQ